MHSHDVRRMVEKGGRRMRQPTPLKSSQKQAVLGKCLQYGRCMQAVTQQMRGALCRCARAALLLFTGRRCGHPPRLTITRRSCSGVEMMRLL